MKKLEDMSEVELKGMCYDQLVQIEQCQGNLKFLNQELANRAKPKPVETPVEKNK